MKIINRYVLREHAGPFFFALTALTSLLLLNYIAKQFHHLVGKGLPWQVIAEFFALSVPFTVAMTLPMAVLIGVLYAFSRLAAENEITALKASGVSLVRLLFPVIGAGVVTTFLMLGLNDQLLPRANHRLRKLQGDIAQKKPTFALRPRVINEVVPGQMYIQANFIDEYSNRMREVTIYDMSDPMRRRTITADSGDMGLSRGKDLLLTLFDGNMQEVPKSTPQQMQRLFFSIDHVIVPDVANELTRDDSDNYKSDREKSVCELQREVAAADRAWQIAHYHLQQTLLAVVGEATTGRMAMFEMYSPGPPSAGLAPYPIVKGANPEGHLRPRRTLARYYCDLVDRFEFMRVSTAALHSLLSPAPAFAAEPEDQAPSTTAAQDTAKRRDSTAKVDPLQMASPGLDTTRVSSMRFVPRQVQDSAHAAAAQAVADTATAAPPIQSDPGGALIPSSGESVTATEAVAAARTRMTENATTANANAVEIQKKFALSAACIVFVLIGPPIALRFPRGGVGLTMGVSLVIFALYYVGLIAGETLGDRGILPPWVAMWWPNAVLTLVALALLARMGREASTSRGGDFGEMMYAFRLWLARRARAIGIPAERRRMA